MPVARHQFSRQQSNDQKLPRAVSSVAPPTAKRITIFGTSNVMNNLGEGDLEKDLVSVFSVLKWIKICIARKTIPKHVKVITKDCFSVFQDNVNLQRINILTL